MNYADAGHDHVGHLLSLLAQGRACREGSEDAKKFKQQAVAIIEERLHDDLRRIMFSKFGRQIDEDQGSRRFTELLQRFFVTVLERSPPGLAKVRTRQDLLLYVTGALSNMLRNHFKRNALKREKGGAIAYLASQRQRQLEQDCPVSLGDVLVELDSWNVHGNERHRRWSLVFRYYYVMGMTFEQIGRALNISKSAAERLQKGAIAELRRVFVE